MPKPVMMPSVMKRREFLLRLCPVNWVKSHVRLRAFGAAGHGLIRDKVFERYGMLYQVKFARDGLVYLQNLGMQNRVLINRHLHYK